MPEEFLRKNPLNDHYEQVLSMAATRITRSSPYRRKKLKALQVGGGAVSGIPWSGNPSGTTMPNLWFGLPEPRLAAGGMGVLRHTCRKPVLLRGIQDAPAPSISCGNLREIQGCLRSKWPSASHRRRGTQGGGCAAGWNIFPRSSRKPGERVTTNNTSVHIDDDAMLDMVVGGDEASVLIWNDSLSDTKRNLRVEVRNDTNVGVHNARVILQNRFSKEVFNETTNLTGFTDIVDITLVDKDLTTETRYGPFRMDVSYMSGGTWYNITRFLNITPFTGILEERIYIGNDTDDDGLTDGRETYVLESNSTSSDTDGDSILDGVECGINDTTKPSTTGGGFLADADINTTTSPIADDTDEDGLLDGIEDSDQDGEVDAGETDPCDTDSDDDNLPDGWIDLNSNGKKNYGEYEDYDLDGEIDYGSWGDGGETDPLNNDTDGGGVDDYEEGAQPFGSIDDIEEVQPFGSIDDDEAPEDGAEDAQGSEVVSGDVSGTGPEDDAHGPEIVSDDAPGIGTGDEFNIGLDDASTKEEAANDPGKVEGTVEVTDTGEAAGVDPGTDEGIEDDLDLDDIGLPEEDETLPAPPPDM